VSVGTSPLGIEGDSQDVWLARLDEVSHRDSIVFNVRHRGEEVVGVEPVQRGLRGRVGRWGRLTWTEDGGFGSLACETKPRLDQLQSLACSPSRVGSLCRTCEHRDRERGGGGSYFTLECCPQDCGWADTHLSPTAHVP
jgi:hypothetical protein